MDLEKAREIIHAAMDSVKPGWHGNGGMGSDFNVFARGDSGNHFDVVLVDSDPLFDEFKAAISKALGANCGTVTRYVG